MRIKYWTLCAATLLVATISFALDQSRNGPRLLTEQDARQLVNAAAPKSMTDLPGFGLDMYRRPGCSDFFFFDVLWNNPDPQGSILSGHFAVDLRTGEVWDPLIPKRITSRKLERLQRDLRKKIGLSDSEYKKLRDRYPC
jgi:hypothetical protein